MKRIAFLWMFLLPVLLLAQDVVVWESEVRKLSEDEFDIVITATIEKDWHVYSQFTPEGGPLQTTFTWQNAEGNYTLIGKTEEGKTYRAFSEIFEVDEVFFKDEATFTQRIKLTDLSTRQVDVELFYQVCKDVCYNKFQQFNISLTSEAASDTSKMVDDKSKQLSAALKLNLKDTHLLQSEEASEATVSNNLWKIFGLGFLGGLLALLTPCVFPMIPLTVSFFTKQSQSKGRGIGNALWYGFFIVLIYFLLSLPFHLFDSVDSQILNTIATNVWLNVFFFAIFVFFAFSFFGYYELTLPSSWANRMDATSSKVGGVLGIFFMAVTLAIVSFSCTGPILGGLLGSTVLGEGDVATNLSTGMVGFGVALALPFALFALFPAWLNSLPKSGAWMNTVKVVLGFLELALALKFLSNADLVGHWDILKREIFIGIWIVLFALMALFLFGIIRFPHQGPRRKLPLPRLLTGLIATGFVVYLGLGLFGLNRLQWLSGFPPPAFYSVFEQESDCPLGIDCFKDFDEGLAFAQENNKPIMLDFNWLGLCEL